MHWLHFSELEIKTPPQLFYELRKWEPFFCQVNTLFVCVCVQLQRFSKDYDVGPAYRAVQQAIEQTQVNIQWVSEYKDIVLEWFENEIA